MFAFIVSDIVNSYDLLLFWQSEHGKRDWGFAG